MGRSATGKYRARAYKARGGVTRYRGVIPVGYLPDGKQKCKTVTAATYRECQSKIAALLREVRDHGAPLDRRATLYDYASRWLEHRKLEVKPTTFIMYRAIVNRHLGDYSGYPLSKITPSEIRSIINDARAHDKHGNPAGEASISVKKQIYSCLNQIMTDAMADGLIPTNPVAGVKPPKRTDAIVKRQSFSVPEMQAMLRVASDPNLTDPKTGARMWWRLLTGMRQGEILGAEWDSYDKTKGLYTVDWKLQTVPRDHGCGSPVDGEYPCGKHKGGLCPKAEWRIPTGYDLRPLGGQYALTRPKSQTGRIIPIIPPLQAVLDFHRKNTAKDSNPHGLIFHHDDGRPFDAREDSDDFRALMVNSHIDPDIHTGHETRHSVVTLLAAQGVDFQLIKEIVGHSNDAMVEHYRHADDAERLKAMETLDESLGLEQIGWSGKRT